MHDSVLTGVQAKSVVKLFMKGRINDKHVEQIYKYCNDMYSDYVEEGTLKVEGMRRKRNRYEALPRPSKECEERQWRSPGTAKVEVIISLVPNT